MQPPKRKTENKTYHANQYRLTVVRWHGRTAELRACLDFFAPLFVSRQKVEKTMIETNRISRPINHFITSHVNKILYSYLTIHLLKSCFAKKPKHPV